MTDENTAVYLMWVGSKRCPTIASYVEEAVAFGVSKRLPNANVAGELAKAPATIFLAHDEGKTESCDACVGLMENPDHRVAVNALEVTRRKISQFANELLAAHESDDDREIERWDGKHDRVRAKLDGMKSGLAIIDEFIEGPTGGFVMIDGAEWDYRRYNYWLHQPKKWSADEHEIGKKVMCKTCGGTGQLSLGKVFGAILPSAIEYVMRPEDDGGVAASMKSKGLRVIDAKAATRQSGFYAVTNGINRSSVNSRDVLIAILIADLVNSGVIENGEAACNGEAIYFTPPIDIRGTKRFRGIKRWSMEDR